MASDLQEFERALSYWDELHQDKSYSVPARLGKTAIVVSFDETISPAEHQKRWFTKEANALADSEMKVGREAEVLLDAKGSDISNVLQDPYFTNVVTIGHGSIAYLYIENDLSKKKGDRRYTWRDVSIDANHLKTGYFVQRQCGQAARQLSVPLGSFAMVSHNSVLAATNQYFDPQEIPTSIIDQLKTVPLSSRFSIDEVKRVFPQPTAS